MRRFVEFLVVVCAAPLVALVLSVACASEPRPCAAPTNPAVGAREREAEDSVRGDAAPSVEPAAESALPDWAFATYVKPSTDTAYRVELAADGTYRWAYSGGGVLSGGALLIDVEERGRWRVVRGWIEFQCGQVLDHGLDSDRRLSSCGIVACWRGQRCFLPERDIVAFANAVNRGRGLTPRFFFFAESTTGVAYPASEFTLPPEYADYVLAEPVIATVLTAVDRRALGERGDRVEFTLDRGAADGLRVGHELWTLDLPSADEIPWSGRLVEVGEHTARGRMRFTPFVPAVGSRMSTRHPRAD